MNQQLTIDFDASLSRAFPTLRELVQTRSHQQGRPQKSIAMDMDLSPSHLSRKLSQSPGDSARLTVDDLERFIEVTNDHTPIDYLISKFKNPSSLASTLTDSELKAELARRYGN